MNSKYLKVVLTIIAACQLYSVGNAIISSAYAQSGPINVNLHTVNGVYATWPLAVHAQ